MKGEVPVGVGVESEKVSETPVISEPDCKVKKAGESVVMLTGSSKVIRRTPEVILREKEVRWGADVSGVIEVATKAVSVEGSRKAFPEKSRVRELRAARNTPGKVEIFKR